LGEKRKNPAIGGVSVASTSQKSDFFQHAIAQQFGNLDCIQRRAFA
jgi:hypothetical protein